jgi:transcriptional regulator with XRE-family HTH domain
MEAREEGPNMTIGERLHMFRRRRGWKLDRLARESGISVTTLWRYENDLRDIPSQVMKRIAQALRTTPNDLLGYSDGGDTRV